MKCLYAISNMAIYKARAILLMAAILFFLLLFLTYGVFHTYGLSAADGGQLKPLMDRILMAGAVALLAIVVVFFSVWYATSVVLRITREGNKVIIETFTPIGGLRGNQHCLDPGDISRVTDQEGTVFSHVDNILILEDYHWLCLHVHKKIFPFLINLRDADMVETSALLKLASSLSRR